MIQSEGGEAAEEGGIKTIHSTNELTVLLDETPSKAPPELLSFQSPSANGSIPINNDDNDNHQEDYCQDDNSHGDMTTSPITLFQEESVEKFQQPNILSPRIRKGTRKDKPSPAVLGSPPPKQQEKRQRRKSAPILLFMPTANESIECDINGIVAGDETFSEHSNAPQSEDSSSEDAVNKKICCLLQQVHDNGNKDDIRAIQELMMEFLTGIATAKKIVLQKCSKN